MRKIIVGGGAGESPLDLETPFTVTWTSGTDPDGDPLTYTWQLAAATNFSTVLFEQDVGAGTSLETTLGTIAGVLDAAGTEEAPSGPSDPCCWPNSI